MRPTNPQPPGPREQEVIDELSHLLRQFRLQTEHGAYAKGRHLAVSADSRPAEGARGCPLLITCVPLGLGAIQLQGVPIFIRSDESEEAQWVRFLDARGQTLCDELPPGTYRLSAPARYGRSREPVPLPLRAPGLAAQSMRDSAPAAVYASVDGRVHATVRATRTGSTRVVFESADATLASATIRFVLAAPSGQVVHGAAVTLQPVAEEPSLWEGVWVGEVRLHEPCELVFEVLPPEEPPQPDEGTPDLPRRNQDP